MTRRSAAFVVSVALAAAATLSQAKLPPPSPEAKAKAGEAAAKAAWGDKVAAYQLCQAMNRVAARWQAGVAQSGRAASAPVDTPACSDPGAFAPPAPASAPAQTATALPGSGTPAAQPTPPNK